MTKPKQEGWRKKRTGKNAPNWKEKVCKTAVHQWLTRTYGKPRPCEGKDCRGNAAWYDWALKKGCKYEKKRRNFMRLCRSCHRRYDLTPAKIKKGIKNLWWKRGIKNPSSKGGKIENLWWWKDKKKMKEFYEQKKLGRTV